jgi:uncharacterized membrane protein (DUF485 family)
MQKQAAATGSRDILQDPAFKKLVAQKNTISWILTVLELTLYFGFISLIAFNKPLLSQTLGEGSATTIGIPIAVGTIILSWVLTGIYIWWANTRYDQMVKNLRDRSGG